MRAQDIMTRDVITVTPGDTIRHLAQVLTDAGISGAPVLDEQGSVVGVVSEADVIGKRGQSVGDVMRREVISVTPDTGVGEVCRRMSEHGINRTPVLEDGRLIGIITRADIVRAIARGEYGAEADQPDARAHEAPVA
jgi:CBS domain-containing protein